jgi:hypothetical protein
MNMNRLTRRRLRTGGDANGSKRAIIEGGRHEAREIGCFWRLRDGSGGRINFLRAEDW